MDENPALRIWMRAAVPARFRHYLPDEARTGESPIFLAHLPAAVLADPLYQTCNGASGIDGWMEDGALGLFGTNALRTYPHPGGDGLLLIGSCV